MPQFGEEGDGAVSATKEREREERQRARALPPKKTRNSHPRLFPCHVQPGPIAPPRDPATLRPTPFTLPAGLAWADLDMSAGAGGVDSPAAGELATLLAAHYVADAADAFRFAYSPAFLDWALSVPREEGGGGGSASPGGPHASWCVGVRATASGRLVAFIGAVPARLRVPGSGGGQEGGDAAAPSPSSPPSSSTTALPAAEVNFLCVHKKLRSKRLAPLLIRELTRRINAAGVWQAAYTAGVVLPRPAAVARYWHRSLDVAKLCAVGFTRLPPRMTMARAVRLHALPAEPRTPGLRPMVGADAPAVGALLRAYLARFPFAPVLSDAEVAHCLTPRPGVVHSFVVDGPPGAEGTSRPPITDLVSFYTLPSTVVSGAGGHTTLEAAFQYYTVPGSASAKDLVADALVLARDT